MKKSTEVLGLKVMGIKEGRDKGIIQDIVINAAGKSVDHLILKDSRGYGFYGIAFKEVLGMGADYAITSTIENVKKIYESKELLEVTEKGFYLLGATALSSTGDIIGEVSDFAFNPKTGAIEKLFLGNGNEFLADKIAALAGNTAFLNQGEAEFAPEQSGYSEIEEDSIRFLLGKVVKTAVTSDDGEFTVSVGTELTRDILEQAAAHDALLTLTLNV